MAHPTGAGRDAPDPDASLPLDPSSNGGTPQQQPLALTVAARPERVSEMRLAARRFAETHGVPSPDDVALAVGEACANVVIHAYVGVEPGGLHLTAVREDGHVRILVADDGAGLRPRTDSPGLGLGLPLIAQLTDEFGVGDRDGTGTCVRMAFAVRP